MYPARQCSCKTPSVWRNQMAREQGDSESEDHFSILRDFDWRQRNCDTWYPTYCDPDWILCLLTRLWQQEAKR